MSYVMLSALVGLADRNRGELRDPGSLITLHVGGSGTWAIRDLESGGMTLVNSEGTDVAGELVAVVALAAGDPTFTSAAAEALGPDWRRHKATPSLEQWLDLTAAALDDRSALAVQVTSGDPETLTSLAEFLAKASWSWRLSSTTEQSLRTQWDEQAD